MPPRSRLFLLGRAFARLATQKRHLRPDVAMKAKIKMERIVFGSNVDKRLSQQDIRIERLKAKKELMNQKLDTEVKKYKVHEEAHALRIRTEGNLLLFKYMKHGMAVLIFGSGIVAAKIYDLCV